RDVPAECGGALDQISTQYRQGRAHQGRGHAEQPEGEEKSHEAEEPERGRQRLMQPDVDRRQSLERYGKEKGAEPDPCLEARVDRQYTAPPIDESSDPEAAQREPGHERSEDRANGQDRIAEQEVKHAGPRHFIEEAADTGEKAEHRHATTEDSARSGRDHRHGSIQVAASPDTSPSRARPQGARPGAGSANYSRSRGDAPLYYYPARVLPAPLHAGPAWDYAGCLSVRCSRASNSRVDYRGTALRSRGRAEWVKVQVATR